jgi:hypothetical protein
VAGSCEHENQTSGSIKDVKSLDWLLTDSSGVSYTLCIWVHNPFALSKPVVCFPDTITRISARITASQGRKKDTNVVREKEKHTLGS